VMDKAMKEFRNWLCEVEHDLIMCGIGSLDATRLVADGEGALKVKYEAGASAISGADAVFHGEGE
jgi:hypothetical protein